jgi:RNA exonuclease 1
VLQFVGPSTIVVGHSVQNDLKSLRWIHHSIVDTYILEFALKEAAQQANQPATNESPQEIPPESVPLSATEPKSTNESEKRPKGRGLLSLKTLAKVKLGRDIQVGRNGHDSVEDALAARDLVHAYLTQHLNGEIRNMAT